MKLSIIIPVYNLGKSLIRCIESLRNQDLRNIEIIFINDGSTDSSLKILKEVSNELNAIIIDKKNAGVSSARNDGIQIASGEHILFLDGDDYLENDVLTKVIKVISSTPADSFIFNYNYSYDDNAINKYENNKKITFDFFICNQNDLFYNLFQNQSISIWTGCLIISKNIIEKYNLLFDQNYFNGEDLQFFYKCLFLSNKIYCSPLILSNYYQRDGSISNSFNIRKYDAYYAIRDLGIYLQSYTDSIISNYFINDLSFTIFAYNYTKHLNYFIDKDININVLNDKISDTYPSLLKYIYTFKLSDFILKKNKIKYLIFKISPYFYRYLFRLFDID